MSSKAKQKGANPFSKLEMINPHAAGCDLGATEHYVSINEALPREGQRATQVFLSHTTGLEQMVKWLLEHGITTIAIEATGVYWMGVYEALEDAGIEVCLVNARHLKNVAGRKSDVKDSQWIQQLHSYGLLRPSFVPGQEIRDLRAFVRLRGRIVQEKSRAMMHIHKALDMMNIKVHHVIKNMDGPTGMKIIRAIAEGQCNAAVLAAYHTKQLLASKEELQVSLEGNYRKAHVFALQQALQRYDFASEQIKACELEIETLLNRMAYEVDTDKIVLGKHPAKPKVKKGKKNDYRFDLRAYLTELAQVDLAAIDGLSESTVLEIISEVGLDLKEKWPTEKHFVSWLRLDPREKKSGGKVIGHYQQKGANPASQAFRLAARAASRTRSHLGAFYKKKRAQKGARVANKATARKIAVIFYHMMNRKTPYRKQTDKHYNSEQEARQIKRLRKNAERLGFKLERA